MTLFGQYFSCTPSQRGCRTRLSIRQQDPNVSSDTETRCLVYLCLLKGEDYSLTIKTLLNGFPVGQITEKFNTDKLGSLLKKELTEDEDDKKEVEEEALGAKEEKEEDVEEEDPNRLQKQEMEGQEEGKMKSENQDRKKSMNSDATVAVGNTEQED